MKNSKGSLFLKGFFLFILWLFLGWFGAHRFYMKRYKTAILMFLLGGLSLYLSLDVFLRSVTLLIWMIVAGANPLSILDTFPHFVAALFTTSLAFIIVWWLVDIIFIFMFLRNEFADKNNHPEKIYKA